MAYVRAQARRFSVTVDIDSDVVQDSGQKIEFGETRLCVFHRPDRDPSRRWDACDGEELASFDVDDKVYATVSRPGAIDDATNDQVNDLVMRLSLSERFSTKPPETLPMARCISEEERLVWICYEDGAHDDRSIWRGDPVWSPWERVATQGRPHHAMQHLYVEMI